MLVGVHGAAAGLGATMLMHADCSASAKVFATIERPCWDWRIGATSVALMLPRDVNGKDEGSLLRRQHTTAIGRASATITAQRAQTAAPSADGDARPVIGPRLVLPRPAQRLGQDGSQTTEASHDESVFDDDGQARTKYGATGGARRHHHLAAMRSGDLRADVEPKSQTASGSAALRAPIGLEDQGKVFR